MERNIAIVINYVESPGNMNIVRSLSLGIEEEGLPFVIVASQKCSLYDLALTASNHSDLDVGIAVDENSHVGIHQVKLPDGMLLFESQAKQIDCKAYGANAARLIKGIPFKDF